MPDLRSVASRIKKACRCTHGLAIHGVKSTAEGITYPCNHPGCKCRDYKPVKK